MTDSGTKATYREKSCFIVTPVGDDGSAVRREADGIIDAVMRPVLLGLGFRDQMITVAHRMPNPGSITRQIINNLADADLVIANLTGLNPNVMYEVAVRHSARKPIVQICHRDTRLPFDMVHERTIFYVNDIAGSLSLTTSLRDAVRAAMEQPESDISNPIYDAIREKLLLEAAMREDGSPMFRLVVDRLTSLETVMREAASSSSVKRSVPSKFSESYVTLELADQSERERAEIADFIDDMVSLDFQIVSVVVNHADEDSVMYRIKHLGEIDIDALSVEMDQVAEHSNNRIKRIIEVSVLPW